MRRLAEHLGAGSTTLYWHVRTKDDVLDLALPSPAGDWRADVRALITGWRAVMLRHLWAPAPNVLARTEFLQATLARDGFAGAALTQAAAGRPGVSADDHVRAHADAYPTLAATGHLGEQDWDDLFARALDSFLAGLESTR